jgi:hypothetical protein
MTSNAELDRTFGGEDGESPIRFQHDADEVVGRITRDHHWDRRYKIRWAPPEPVEPGTWRMFFEVIGGMVVFAGMFMALWIWLAIAAASQT